MHIYDSRTADGSTLFVPAVDRVAAATVLSDVTGMPMNPSGVRASENVIAVALADARVFDDHPVLRVVDIGGARAVLDPITGEQVGSIRYDPPLAPIFETEVPSLLESS